MRLLDWFRGGYATMDPAAVVGVWQLVRSEGLPHVAAELEMTEDGRMIYAIREGGKWQLMKLTYRLEGDTIVSNQPSAPREERTRFTIGVDGELILAWHGQRSWFRRCEKRSPEV